jgi:cellulose synthase/poly-beta-1,6-N-acetylglucosamine synthase-like glycosyltransferase
VVPRAPRQPVAGLQAVEYLRAFLFGRLGWNRLGGNLIISGAFGLFRRDSLRAIGGYQVDSIGEDMELVVRLRRAGIERGEASRAVFVPEPVAWTEAPESLRVLGRQRDRWQRGLVDVLWRHRRLVFNPRYGAIGLVVTPYFVLVELLGPVIEALGVLGLAVGLGLQLVNLQFALLFLLVVYGWGLLFSIRALLLDELTSRRYEGLADRVLLVCWALIEPLGYRQLTVVWQLRGMVRAARGRSDWGDMSRRGFLAGRSGVESAASVSGDQGQR